nr:hypothetical protein BaRGS_010189 [Batillaria attramentaria]
MPGKGSAKRDRKRKKPEHSGDSSQDLGADIIPETPQKSGVEEKQPKKLKDTCVGKSSRLERPKFEAGVAHTRSDDVEQYTRRNNIRIFGIAESDKENVRDCETKVLKLLHDKLSLRHIQASDLEAVHRVGPARGRQRRRDRRGQGLAGLSPRAIIVRFVSRRVLHDVFVSRRKLKNSGVVIAEDLTTARYQLLKKCKDHPCVDQAWSKNGKIYVKIEGNQSGEEVKSQRDFQKLVEAPVRTAVGGGNRRQVQNRQGEGDVHSQAGQSAGRSRAHSMSQVSSESGDENEYSTHM